MLARRPPRVTRDAAGLKGRRASRLVLVPGQTGRDQEKRPRKRGSGIGRLDALVRSEKTHDSNPSFHCCAKKEIALRVKHALTLLGGSVHFQIFQKDIAVARAQALIILVIFCLSGCGTCANTLVISETGHESYRIYGGMRNDAEVISQSAKRIAAWDNQTIIKHAPATIAGAFFLATVCTLDIPFSLVADTLTLPLCILFTQENDKEAGNATRPHTSNSGENR